MRRAGASGTPPADAPQTLCSFAHLMRMQSAVPAACIPATIWKWQRALPPQLDAKSDGRHLCIFSFGSPKLLLVDTLRVLAKFEQGRGHRHFLLLYFGFAIFTPQVKCQVSSRITAPDVCTGRNFHLIIYCVFVIGNLLKL